MAKPAFNDTTYGVLTQDGVLEKRKLSFEAFSAAVQMASPLRILAKADRAGGRA